MASFAIRSRTFKFGQYATHGVVGSVSSYFLLHWVLNGGARICERKYTLLLKTIEKNAIGIVVAREEEKNAVEVE